MRYVDVQKIHKVSLEPNQLDQLNCWVESPKLLMTSWKNKLPWKLMW